MVPSSRSTIRESHLAENMEIPLHIFEPRDLDGNILTRTALYFKGRIIKHFGAQGHVFDKAFGHFQGSVVCPYFCTINRQKNAHYNSTDLLLGLGNK